MTRQTHEISRQIIRSFEAEALKKRSFAIKFADNLTSFFGSIPFLLANAAVFILWILINTGRIAAIVPFDPFPFPMLTTVVSLEAIILTLIVLMSQNRQSLISSLREEMDIQVNLAAEREITKILQLLNVYFKARGIKIEDKELEDMLKEIDASYIERKLREQLDNKEQTFIEKVTKPIISEVEEEVERVAGPLKNTSKKS